MSRRPLAQPLALPVLALTALVLLAPLAPADGQQVGLPCTISGPALASTLAGDLGPAPGGPFDELACLEIRNDRTFERADETAFSSIPLPEALGITDVAGLAVVGPGGRLVAAQLGVTSRWGGVADDPTLPIRWLAVATRARVPAATTVTYSLRRYATPPTPADPFAASITPDGAGGFTVDTGLATFELDPSNPALFEAISIDLDDDGTGRTAIHAHAPGAGPRLDVGGLVLDTATPGRVTVDQVGGADDFRILEDGPVRVTVAARGHFTDPGGSTLCAAIAPSYERFGYTLVATFFRGSRDVELAFHVRNECSDAFNAPWDDDGITIDRASFELPLALTPDNAYSAGIGATVRVSPNGFAGLTVAEQRKGAGNPWTRRARLRRDTTDLATGETLDRPLVAVAGSGIVGALSMPWMEYREPQGIAVDGAALSLRPIGAPQLVGEAKGIWSRALVRLTSTALALAGGGDLAGWVGAQRDPIAIRLERGLLVRVPLAQVNASGLFPSLGTAATSTVKTHYETMIGRLHDETVSAGGQWDQAKTFGSQLWPEVASRDPYAIENDTPADHPSEYNYWNPTTAELLEFLRTGDPRWVWDFALPQSWLQGFTAYVNIGEYDHGNRNGFAAAAGGTGVDGQWHRPNCLGVGVCGSADYTYNTGMHLAHALHPHPALVDRFGQMGRTAIGRYDIPQEDQGDRERFVNEVDIDRFHVQNFEGLANCAEMVPGAQGQACHDKLMEIAAELVDDNLSAGAMCQGDIPDPVRCAQPQQFMKNSMFYGFFMRLLRNYGDLEGGLRRALIEGPESFYQWGAPRLGNGIDLNVDGDWAPVLNCDKTAGGADVTNCVIELVDGSPMFFPNRPQTMALLLMAHELDPSVGLCPIARTALENFGDLVFLWEEYALPDRGWIKGSAQMMQSMAFAIGLYDTCDGSQPGNAAPTVVITAPADGSSFDDSAPVQLAGTATDPEDGNLAVQITWSSDLDGALGTGAALGAALSVGTHVVTAAVTDSGGLPGADTVTVTITAAGNTAPDVTITAPADGAGFDQGETISFTATATDPEDGDLAAQVAWTSNRDGALGTGASLDVVLSLGTHQVSAAATDSGNATGTDTITVTVTAVGNTAPTVAITGPGNGASFPATAPIAFMGTATDPEDGDLAASLAWSSDRDGPIGIGASFSATLSAGTHVVTASVTDSGGADASDTVTLTVFAGGCGGGGALLDEDFEGGLGGWQTTGLWHLVANSPCAPPGSASPPNAVYFGQDGTCNYDTGVAESGDLVSPAVAGIGDATVLDFAFFRQVEDTPDESWDRAEVAVSAAGADDWTVVWQRDSTDPSGETWGTAAGISLAAWAGQAVEVRFRFDSGDELENGFVGWLVDDVRISSPCAGGLFVDGFETGDLSAWGP